jgi:sugar phosphate isomerase/epimerase
VKLGLLTAAFPELTLEQVAQWANANGFEALEIACWPSSGGERRRYAGVSHIDVESFDPKKVRDLLSRYNLEISSLAYYPNNLDPDHEARQTANDHLRHVIEAAQKLEVGIVGTFVGRDQHRSVSANLVDF